MTEKNKKWDDLEFEEIQTENENLKWIPSQPDDSIIGKYMRTENGSGGGQNYLFHILEDQDGQCLSILGCAKLNRLLETIEPGQIIKVIYKGWKPSKNGNRYKDYIVLQAKDTD